MADTSALSTYWNTAREIVGSRDIRRPIVRDQTAVIYTERWQQAESAYSVTPLDTEHPTKSGYYLTDEQIIDRAEDLLTFERTYATIPASRDDPSTLAYLFPGIADDGFGFGTHRAPQDEVVPVRARYDYFLEPRAFPTAVTGATGTASTDVIAASGHPFQAGDRVTYVSGTTFTGLTTGTTYFARDVVAGVSFKLAATKGGAAIDLTADGTDGVFAGGIPILRRQRFLEASSGYEINYVINSGWGTYGSIPSKATYQGWMANRTEMIALDSQLSPYAGNIHERVTLYVIAR
jgi:hypothetical protein